MTDLVKVALIAATPPTIIALGNFIISLYAKRDQNKIAAGVDGINTGLQLRADNSDASRNEAQKELAHATGRREGIESTEQNGTSNGSVKH